MGKVGGGGKGAVEFLSPRGTPHRGEQVVLHSGDPDGRPCANFGEGHHSEGATSQGGVGN